MPFYRDPLDIFRFEYNMYHIQPKKISVTVSQFIQDTQKTHKNNMAPNCTICVLIKL